MTSEPSPDKQKEPINMMPTDEQREQQKTRKKKKKNDGGGTRELPWVTPLCRNASSIAYAVLEGEKGGASGHDIFRKGS